MSNFPFKDANAAGRHYIGISYQVWKNKPTGDAQKFSTKQSPVDKKYTNLSSSQKLDYLCQHLIFKLLPETKSSLLLIDNHLNHPNNHLNNFTEKQLIDFIQSAETFLNTTSNKDLFEKIIFTLKADKNKKIYIKQIYHLFFLTYFASFLADEFTKNESSKINKADEVNKVDDSEIDPQHAAIYNELQQFSEFFNNFNHFNKFGNLRLNNLNNLNNLSNLSKENVQQETSVEMSVEASISSKINNLEDFNNFNNLDNINKENINKENNIKLKNQHIYTYFSNEIISFINSDPQQQKNKIKELEKVYNNLFTLPAVKALLCIKPSQIDNLLK